MKQKQSSSLPHGKIQKERGRDTIKGNPAPLSTEKKKAPSYLYWLLGFEIGKIILSMINIYLIAPKNEELSIIISMVSIVTSAVAAATVAGAAGAAVAAVAVVAVAVAVAAAAVAVVAGAAVAAVAAVAVVAVAVAVAAAAVVAAVNYFNE